MRPRIERNDGSALVMSLIIGFIFLSGLVWFSHWGWDRGQVQQRDVSSQKAYQYADSGMNVVRPWLKSPTSSAELAGGATSFMLLMDNGRCDVALYRTSPDPSLVNAYTTGYYYLPAGAAVDPLTQRRAQVASIHAVFKVNNLSQYLAALPGNLTLGYGTNALGGIVYAQNLTFASGIGAPTQVGQAFYSSSVQPSTAPAFVVFQSTPPMAQQTVYPPVFATLDSSMESYYGSIAAPPAETPVDFSNAIQGPTGGASVYYVNGDVDLAANGPLIVSGVWVLYATGQIRIHNNITTADGASWAAFLSEQDIHITADAPDTISLTGNYICNGLITADAPSQPRHPGNISFTGGLVTMSDIALYPVYGGTRTYAYATINDPRLLLPNVSLLLERDVSGGGMGFK